MSEEVKETLEQEGQETQDTSEGTEDVDELLSEQFEEESTETDNTENIEKKGEELSEEQKKVEDSKEEFQEGDIPETEDIVLDDILTELQDMTNGKKPVQKEDGLEQKEEKEEKGQKEEVPNFEAYDFTEEMGDDFDPTNKGQLNELMQKVYQKAVLTAEERVLKDAPVLVQKLLEKEVVKQRERDSFYSAYPELVDKKGLVSFMATRIEGKYPQLERPKLYKLIGDSCIKYLKENGIIKESTTSPKIKDSSVGGTQKGMQKEELTGVQKDIDELLSM